MQSRNDRDDKNTIKVIYDIITPEYPRSLNIEKYMVTWGGIVSNFTAPETRCRCILIGWRHSPDYKQYSNLILKILETGKETYSSMRKNSISKFYISL